MQLNNQAFKTIRNLRSFWVSLLAIIFGLVFFGLGIYFFITDTAKTYETAVAVITSQEMESIDDQTTYHITLKYTDKDGNEHTGITMDTSDSSWTIGKEVQIKYNVDDFNDVSTTTPAFVLPLVFMGVGLIVAIIGVVSIINTTKRFKRKVAGKEEVKSISNSFIDNYYQNTKFFFHYSGKLNQSYTIEDQNGNVVFECKLLKFNPIGANLFEFSDPKTGSSQQYKIGKTITSSSAGSFSVIGDILTSHFTIDNKNCWDYVASRGYEIKQMLDGRTILSYEIMKDNEMVAKICPANFQDPFNEESRNILKMVHGVYRLELIDANLPDIVMIAFIIGRTELVE